MIKIIQGFDVGSPLPIDGRILLSKEEMLNIDDNIMPDRYFCICEDDEDNGLLFLYDKNAPKDDVTGRFHKAVPEKLSQLENDGSIDSEGNYHPFDTVDGVIEKVQYLRDQVSSEEEDIVNSIQYLRDQVSSEEEAIYYRINEVESETIDSSELEETLTKYSLIKDTGCKLQLSSNSSEYIYTISLLNKDNNILDEVEFDLPIEQVVMSVEYVETHDRSDGEKFIVITLDNGVETWVPVDAIIDGLLNESTFNTFVETQFTPLKNDFDEHVTYLYDSSSESNKPLHVTYNEAKAWDDNIEALDELNAKFNDLTSEGISLDDLSDDVKESLSKANSALQKDESYTSWLINNGEDSESGQYVTEKYFKDNVFNGESTLVIDPESSEYEWEFIGDGYIQAGKNIIVENGSEGKIVSAHIHKFIPGDGVTFVQTTGSDYEDVTQINTVSARPQWDQILGDPLSNTALSSVFDSKQNLLSAGTGITISNNTISATEYSLADSTHNGLMASAAFNKLSGIAEGAEVNVQADWAVTDSTSDAFIKSKPVYLQEFQNRSSDAYAFKSEVDANTALISANTSAISNNASLISANTSSIASNKADIDAINLLIPSEASSTNKLVDQAAVTSAINLSTLFSESQLSAINSGVTAAFVEAIPVSALPSPAASSTNKFVGKYNLVTVNGNSIYASQSGSNISVGTIRSLNGGEWISTASSTVSQWNINHKTHFEFGTTTSSLSTVGPTASSNLAFGATFTVPGFNIDRAGHLSGSVSTYTMTMPKEIDVLSVPSTSASWTEVATPSDGTFGYSYTVSYTNNQNLSTITSSSTVIVDLRVDNVSSSTGYLQELEAFGKIYRVTTDNQAIIFWAYEIPSTNTHIAILG